MLLPSPLQGQDLASLALKLMEQLLAMPVLPHLKIPLNRASHEALELLRQIHIAYTVIGLSLQLLVLKYHFPARNLIEAQELFGPRRQYCVPLKQLAPFDPCRRFLNWGH